MKNKKNFNYNYVFLFYDVGEKRVGKLFKKCKKYLHHWQNSVFRGEITPAKIIELENELEKIIIPEEDFISIVKLISLNDIGETVIGKEKNNTEELFI